MRNRTYEQPTNVIDQQLIDITAQIQAHDEARPTPKPTYRHNEALRSGAREVQRLGGAGLRKLKTNEVDNYAMQLAMPDSQARNFNKQDKIDRLLVIANKIVTETQEDDAAAREDATYKRARFFWLVKSKELDARKDYLRALLASQDPRNFRYTQAEELMVKAAQVRVFEEMSMFAEERGEKLYTIDEVREYYVRFLVKQANTNPCSRSTSALSNLIDDIERAIIGKEMDYGIFSRLSL